MDKMQRASFSISLFAIYLHARLLFNWYHFGWELNENLIKQLKQRRLPPTRRKKPLALLQFHWLITNILTASNTRWMFHLCFIHFLLSCSSCKEILPAFWMKLYEINWHYLKDLYLIRNQAVFIGDGFLKQLWKVFLYLRLTGMYNVNINRNYVVKVNGSFVAKLSEHHRIMYTKP